MSTCRIIVIRHGVTEWNICGKLQGHLDSPLTDIGVKQAQCLASRLKKWDIDAIYSSDLDRAYQTAKIIAKNQNINTDINLDKRLRERNLGIFQGFTIKEIEKKFAKEFNLYNFGDPDYIVPKGESLNHFFLRVTETFEEIAKKNYNKQILIVSHGGILNSIIKYILEIPIKKKSKITLFNAGINIISLKNDNWSIETLGDISHLKDVTSFRVQIR